MRAERIRYLDALLAALGLAAIGHAWGMSKAERIRLYRVAEEIPLSDRHAGHILARLKRSAA